MMHRFLNTGGGLYKSKLAYLRLAVPVLAFLFVSSLLTASISTPAFNADAASPTLVSASVIRPAFALTLSVSPSVTLNLEPTPTGVMSVVSSTVSAATTSPSGYRLYLEMTGANSTDNSLIHTTDNNKKFTSSGTLESPVALANGTWGYAIAHSASSVNSDNGFDASYTTMASGTPTENKFAAVPASPSPAQRIAETDYVGGIDLTVFYGARADYTTASGAYTNKVLYTAVADDGAAPTVVATPDTVSTTGGDTIILTTSLHTTNPDITADAYLLTPAEYAAVTRAENPVDVSTYSSKKMTCSRVDTVPLTLSCTTVAAVGSTHYVYVDIPHYNEHYSAAVTNPTPSTFFELSTMQEMATFPSLCSTATTPAANATALDTTGAYAGNTSYVPTIELRDTRDDNVYTVSKLADGNCWMTENLKLGKDTTMTLTSADSDVVNDFEIPAVQTSGATPWGSSAQNPGNAKGIYATGDDGYGNLYNWYTATAGTGVNTMVSSSATALTNAASSVCPKGWRLPDGGQSTDKSFYQLDISYGGTGANRTDASQVSKFVNSPLNYTYTGFYNFAGGYGSNGTIGQYWTRSASTTSGYAYLHYIHKTGNYIQPQRTAYVGYGNAIRCVARGDFWDITYMQEMTPAIAASVETPGASATATVTTRAAYNAASNKTTIVPQRTLYDIRDGNSYTVIKAPDGNVWMSQNLRLGKSGTTYTLTPANSNVSTNFALPAAQTSGTTSWGDAENSSNAKHLYASGNTTYGNYYNWYTATAGTGLGTMSSASTTDLTNASASICPKGWRLPDGGESPTKSFYALDRALGGDGTNRTDATQRNKFINSPYNFPYSGNYHYSGSSNMNQGSAGRWWTRSAHDTVTGYAFIQFLHTDDRFFPRNANYVAFGFSMRCVNE